MITMLNSAVLHIWELLGEWMLKVLITGKKIRTMYGDTCYEIDLPWSFLSVYKYGIIMFYTKTDAILLCHLYIKKEKETRCDGFSFFFFNFFFVSWRLITLQYCNGFCHTLTWISHGYTCIPHPNPPSHLPLHLIPLGLPSVPGPSTCLMHPTWAGDLFHPR